MCLTHLWREVQEIFLVKLLELNTLNEHFSYEFLMRKKYLFIWKTICDKVQRLAEGVIKSLKVTFNKVLEKYHWRNSLALVFQVSSQTSAMFVLTGVYKKFQKNFQRAYRWLLSNYDFFLQVYELSKKLDELSLKGWIHPWYVYFLAFKRLVNKNFNHLIFLFKDIIWLFLVKTIVCSAKFLQTFAKIYSLVLPFFSFEPFLPKSI